MEYSFEKQIFSLDGSDAEFNDLCLKIFDFQMLFNPTYSEWVKQLGRPGPTHYSEIPFLPISFFKTRQIIISGESPEMIFSSSTTTGNYPSLHHVVSTQIYKESFLSGFQRVYGSPDRYIFLGLLPGYMERRGSSLIYMVRELIVRSGDKHSGMFSTVGDIRFRLKNADNSGKKVMLIGVSFALLDLFENFYPELKNTIIMETGGMKGRRKELTREALHEVLKTSAGVKSVHSEYGMTELLSQAYSTSDGLFHCPPWMRVLIRQTTDPLDWEKPGKTGGINVIDLANMYSCPFIATDDLGRFHSDGSFEVLGRFDHSEVRGCNLLVE